MRIILRLILITILLFFNYNSSVLGQKIIEYKGDTLIVITPQNVATMNSIIVERNYLKKEVSILNDLNSLKDSTIQKQEQVILITEESLLQTRIKNELVIQEQVYEWKKKVHTWSGISVSIGLILGILITR